MPKAKINLQHVLAHDKLEKKKIIHNHEVATLRKSVEEFIGSNDAKNLFKKLKEANLKKKNHIETLRKLDKSEHKIHDKKTKNEKKEDAILAFTKGKKMKKGSAKTLRKLHKKDEKYELLDRENAAEKEMLQNKEDEDERVIDVLNEEITRKNLKLHELNVGLKHVLDGTLKQEHDEMVNELEEKNAEINELRSSNVELNEKKKELDELLAKLEESNEEMSDLRQKNEFNVNKSSLAIEAIGKLQSDIAEKDAELKDARRLKELLRVKEAELEVKEKTINRQMMVIKDQVSECERLKHVITNKDKQIQEMKKRLAADIQLILCTSQNEIMAVVQSELSLM